MTSANKQDSDSRTTRHYCSDDTLNSAITLLADGRLAKVLDILENCLIASNSTANDKTLGSAHASDMETLTALRDDYRLLTGYWQRGFSDPQRDDLFMRLQQRAYSLAANIILRRQLADSTFLNSIHQRSHTGREQLDIATLKGKLEDFVAQVTVLQMEPEVQRRQHGEALQRDHQALMSRLFGYIVTSRLWRPQTADAFIDILLSPTLYTTDQQLIVSAIMLSAMQMFCPQKWRVLTEVYLRSEDEPLQQRALVGWVLVAAATDSSLLKLHYSLFTIHSSLFSPLQLQQLAEMQMQMVYCTETDADTRTIQEEILPEIMNGSNLKITERGIVESDDDSLEDILHPEAAEQNMERMEQSIKRMADMQRQGTDIYFGGFSQMKRFPFFSDFANWFTPFYPQHPAISQIWQNSRGKKFLKAITKAGAFCDSDKYSFVLAFDQVLDRLPQSMVKMIDEGEAVPMPLDDVTDMQEEERQKAPYMRRMYLQDLYRFYRVFPARSDFYSPFADGLFFAHSLFSVPALAKQAIAVARFLMKRRRYADVVRVLTNISPEAKCDTQYYILLGTALQHAPAEVKKRNIKPAECFRRALEMEPDNEKARAALARALFADRQYDEALQLYNTLTEQQPEHRTYLLNAAVCMLNTGRADDAMQQLYKLSFTYTDDATVQRVLAWTLIVNNRLEQAEKIYATLTAAEKPEPADRMNYGYCLWLQGRVGEAVSMFRQLKGSNNGDFDLQAELMNSTEHRLLTEHGVTDTEIKLMLDAVET